MIGKHGTTEAGNEAKFEGSRLRYLYFETRGATHKLTELLKSERSYCL